MTKRYSINLSDEEGRELLFIIKKGETPVSRIKHAQILLNSDQNGPNKTDREIAEFIKCHPQTVFNVRKKYSEMGLEPALYRKHRESSPIQPIVDGKKEAQLISIACSQPPEGRSRWTFKLLSERMVELEIIDSISPKTVERVLNKRTQTSLKKMLGYTTKTKR
jgi:transposase